MSEYFTHFPRIQYDPYGTLPTQTVSATNIFVRNTILNEIKNQTAIFYPYVIQDNERPDVLSFNYYGSVKYTWLIFFANNILDPYSEWPMSSNQFRRYIISKYGSAADANSTIHSYYETVYSDVNGKTDIQIDQIRYNLVSSDLRYTKSYLDYENELNEQKRNIVLIEDVYIKTIFNQAKTTLK